MLLSQSTAQENRCHRWFLCFPRSPFSLCTLLSLSFFPLISPFPPLSQKNHRTPDSLVRVPLAEELDGALVGDLLNVGGKSESHFD